jgi:hypothetical protein
MDSKLLDYLMHEREAELIGKYETKLRQQEEHFRQQEEHFRQQEEHFRQELQQVLEDTLMVRFPSAPITLVRDIRRLRQIADLRRLIVDVQQVSELSAVEQLLHEAAGRE